MEAHDFLKAAQSFKAAAELLGELGEPSAEYYEKAGGAYVEFAKGMLQVKNQSKAQEGFENAVFCFEKAGAQDEIEKISHLLKPATGEREKQVTEELARLKADFEKGLLPEKTYVQIKEGYQELLKRLRQ